MSDSLIEAVRPTFKTKEAVNEWLQNQATLLLQQIVAQQQANANETVATEADVHTPWVQSMAKYRRLSDSNSKDTLIESLDERFL